MNNYSLHLFIYVYIYIHTLYIYTHIYIYMTLHHYFGGILLFHLLGDSYKGLLHRVFELSGSSYMGKSPNSIFDGHLNWKIIVYVYYYMFFCNRLGVSGSRSWVVYHPNLSLI